MREADGHAVPVPRPRAVVRGGVPVAEEEDGLDEGEFGGFVVCVVEGLGGCG